MSQQGESQQKMKENVREIGQSEHNRQSSVQPDIIIQHRVPPVLLRIYADDQTKKSNILFWGAFVAFFISLAISTIFLPQPTLIRVLPSELAGTYLQQCEYPVKWDTQKRVQCGDFNPSKGDLSVGYLVNDIQNLNQFAIFYITIHTKNSSVELNISQPIQTFYTDLSKTQVDANNQKSFFFEQKGTKVIGNSQFSLDSASMDTQNQGAYTKNVLIDRLIDSNYFIFILTFSNADQLKNVQSITWKVLTVNHQFTVFTIVLRYLFFVVGIFSLLQYSIRFLKIPRGQRVIEQRLILFLGGIVLLFNDPLYPITILAPNGFSNFLSVFFVVNFIIFLMFFWIIMFDRIHLQNGEKDTNVIRWYKVAYVALLYIFTIILYLNYAYNHLQSSPVLPTDQLTSGRFLALQIITIFIAVLGFLYIFIRCLQICAKLEQKLHRNKLFCFFSLFFMIIMIAFFIIGGMKTYNYDQNRVLFFYGGMNLYVFYLLRMYSITSDQLLQLATGFRQVESDYIIDAKPFYDKGVYLDLDELRHSNGNSGRIDDDIQIHGPFINKERQVSNARNGSNVQYLRQQRQQEKVKTKIVERQMDQPQVDFFQKKQSNERGKGRDKSPNNNIFQTFGGVKQNKQNKQIEEQNKKSTANMFQKFQIQ